MFNCEFCGRAFMKKFNLQRHLNTKHNIANNGNDTENKETNEYNINGIDDDDDRSVSDTIHISNDSDVNSINESPLPEVNRFNQKVPYKKNCFDQRMLTATEAIKQKFNSLKSCNKFIQNFENNDVSENSNTTSLEAKLPEFLQCLLDILMIKELQNVDIRDKDEETDTEGNKNFELKRRFSSVSEQGIVDEIKSPEETPLKRLKYGNSMEHENDNSSINSECVVKKYWHDPNTLVDKLRELINTTNIGQQVSTIIRLLNKNNIKSNNYFEYIAHKEERNELIRNLNELKKTDIGQEIFCILNELEKAEIIEPVDYVTNEEKHSSDIEDVTTGKGLYSTISKFN